MGPAPPAIDVHSHFMPAAALAEVNDGGVPGLSQASDVSARLEWMASHGFSAQVVGPELQFARYDLAPREGAAWARRLNRLTAEAVAGHPQLSLLAAVPLQAGDRAAAELEHAVRELRFSGAMIHSRGPHSLHDPELDPFWATASRLGVPVAVHSGQPVGDPRLDQLGLASSLGRANEVTIAAAQLILGGVLDRFPDLKIVLLMAGGALPFLISRLDATSRAGAPKPTSHLRRLYFDTLCYGRPQLRLLLDLVGPERLVLGSDWPIQQVVPDTAGWLSELGIGDADRTRVMAGNAAELFGLESTVRHRPGQGSA